MLFIVYTKLLWGRSNGDREWKKLKNFLKEWV